jgi:hypothetical protein
MLTHHNTSPARQVTTDTRRPVAERNAAVVKANISCAALGCERGATRWSNLCGLCERQFLENMKPVFGKPTKDQLATAQAVIRGHFADQISNGVFDAWASQLGRTFSRPLSLLPAPLRMKGYRTPKQRFNGLLALRIRDRGMLTRTSVINLLAFALAVDALITPTIPQPVRTEYMIALLGQRFMRREVYSQTINRWRTRKEKTGVIRYGLDGPVELTRTVEEEVPVKEFCRIRRSDLRYIGRRLWKALATTVVGGDRNSAAWLSLKNAMVMAEAEHDGLMHGAKKAFGWGRVAVTEKKPPVNRAANLTQHDVYGPPNPRKPPRPTKHAWFDPWLIPKGDALGPLIREVTDVVEDKETRQRKRRADDQR